MTVMVNQTGQYHFYSSNLVLILTMNQSLFGVKSAMTDAPSIFQLHAFCLSPACPVLQGQTLPDQSLCGTTMGDADSGEVRKPIVGPDGRPLGPDGRPLPGPAQMQQIMAQKRMAQQQAQVGVSFFSSFPSFSFAPCRWMRWWGL